MPGLFRLLCPGGRSRAGDLVVCIVVAVLLLLVVASSAFGGAW